MVASARLPPRFSSPSPYCRSNLLHRQRHALTDADAHAGEGALAAALFEPVHRGQSQPRPRHAERMTERNSAAMRIDVIGVLGHAELAQAGDALRGKGLVDFDQIEIADLQPEPR